MCYAFFMITRDFVIHCSLGSFFSSGSKLNIETEFSSPRCEMKAVGDSYRNINDVRHQRPSLKPELRKREIPVSQLRSARSPVDDQLDVVRKIFGDFCDHVALEEMRQGLAMR